MEISNFEGILVGFQQKDFPVGGCVHQNEQEPDVFDSKQAFLCVLVDDRFPDSFRCGVMYPYTAKDLEDPNILLYGWASQDGNHISDHFERAVRYDHERVVAWKKILSPEITFMRGEWED